MKLFLIQLNWDYDGVEWVIYAARDEADARALCLNKYREQILSVEHLGTSKGKKRGVLHEFIHYG